MDMWKYLKCRLTGRFASSEELACVLLQMGAEDTRLQLEVRLTGVLPSEAARKGIRAAGKREVAWIPRVSSDQL